MTLSTAAAAASLIAPKIASAQAIGFTPSPIYPIQPSGSGPELSKYRIASASLEQVATGARWLEGPVYFADGKYPLVSEAHCGTDASNGTCFEKNSTFGPGTVRLPLWTLTSLFGCEHPSSL
jgi:hypothetical protein